VSERHEQSGAEPAKAPGATEPAKALGFAAAAGGKAGPTEPMVQRSPRQVRTAARILHKEAQRILKKHAARVAPEPAQQMRTAMAEIERLRGHEDLRALQLEAERLDELLEQHASFARKSALRETLENIGIAVLIALGLRSCLYEPFKIPSGSMMPTLRTGDHIFVNKFVYGIQIPFTTTVVGESLGHIERGDVIVFRYPVDETQDFIKRVVGLPGDEIKVEGRLLSVKPAGQSEWQVLPRKKLEQRCFDPESGDKPIANCTLYEETLDGKTYVVRYKLNTDERQNPLAPAQVWKVPEGHLMVMGDNRNDSLDSRRWTVPVEAVKADGLLSTKDLRDLTDERLFSMDRPAYFDQQAEYSHDHVTFRASHRALDHDLALEVWREPSLGPTAVRRAKESALRGLGVQLREQGWEALVGSGVPDEAPAALETRRRHGEGIEALVVGEDPDARHAVLQLREPVAVLAFACGKAVCPTDAALARAVGDVLERFAQNRGREARELLVRPDGPTNYSSQFKTRHNPRDHYYERRFASAEVPGPRGQVRLAAFRRPDDGTLLVRDAALWAVGVDPKADAPPPVVDGQGIESWVVEQHDAWVGIACDPAREIVVVLECGKTACNREAKGRELLDVVIERMPRAAGDRRRLPMLLEVADVGGLPEVPSVRGELAEYDRAQLEATVKGESHSVELEAWLRPAEGLPGKLEALREAEGGLEADDAALPGAWSKGDAQAVTLVFPVPHTETVVRLRCNKGLCPTRETAVALAQRAAQKALDPENFVDPEAERPLPFVPRGNVKGRAERIWLPLSRFWLPVR
jgi:signal peptidase I